MKPKTELKYIDIKYLPQTMIFTIKYLDVAVALVKAADLNDENRQNNLEQILKIFHQRLKLDGTLSSIDVPLSIAEIKQNIIPFNPDLRIYSDMPKEELNALRKETLESILSAKSPSLLKTLNNPSFTFKDLISKLIPINDLELKEIALLLFKLNIEEYYELLFHNLKEEEKSQYNEINDELIKLQ